MKATIADLIREIVKPLIKKAAFAATVLKVDETNETCTVKPIDDGPEVFNVRLTGVVKSKKSKVLIVPVIGSDVIVASIDNSPTTCYIAQFSEIKSVKVIADKVEAECKEIIYNKGANGGIVISAKIAEKLNILETLSLALVADVETLAKVVGATLTASKLQQAKPTLPTELENTKIKH